MALDVNKVLAREGMILLGCALCAITLFFISQSIPPELPQYRYRCVIAGHSYKVTISNHVINWGKDSQIALYDTIKKTYPDDFKKNASSAALPKDFRVEYRGAVYTHKGDIKNATLIFSSIAFFLVYPFYWVIRFFIWAVKTLRKK